MFCFYANDGRVLTPPKELKPQLKGAYPAFYSLLGHIRFFFVADELWDGVATVVFNTDGGLLAVITLSDGLFTIKIEDENYTLSDESPLIDIYEKLRKTATINQRRPKDQLSVDLDEYPNGIRCDLCQLYRDNNLDDLSGCENFRIMDHHCYYGVEEGWGIKNNNPVNSNWICDGKQGCFTKSYACIAKKEFENCLQCGEYHTCGNCGVGHNPGECNLGITADEVTKLIIPFCETERLDLLRKEI